MTHPPHRPTVLRHVVLAVLAVAACALALVNSYPWSGPVLVSVTPTHGLHATDPLFLTLAPLCVVLLARSARRAVVRPAVPSGWVLAA